MHNGRHPCRDAPRHGTIVSFEVGRKIPEDPHGNFSNFPADLSRYIKNQKTVDTCLIATGIA